MNGYIPSSTTTGTEHGWPSSDLRESPTRIPLFHLFISPVLIANLGLQIVAFAKNPSWTTGWAVAMAAALYGVAFSARYMALVLQNRLISLEQRLRLGRLVPEDLRSRVDELKLGQLIALRFASDEELPALTRRCLAGEFATNNAIKRAVTNWRRDTLRV